MTLVNACSDEDPVEVLLAEDGFWSDEFGAGGLRFRSLSMHLFGAKSDVGKWLRLEHSGTSIACCQITNKL